MEVTTKGTVCEKCSQQLVSAPLLQMSRQINYALHHEKTLKCFIIDDDPLFQTLAKELFVHSKTFSDSTHINNGPEALAFLFKHKNQTALLPDYIFLDVNMPLMDAWEFLDEFEMIEASLDKIIKIYVITGSVNPVYRELIKPYHSVKDIITKDFDLEFLDAIC